MTIYSLPNAFLSTAAILLTLHLAQAQSEAPTKDMPVEMKVEDVREDDIEFAAFKSGVYKYVSNKCKKCHGVEGKSSKPQFARGDNNYNFELAAQSYVAARPFIDFKSVEKSIFLERATNDHCGKPCKSDGNDMRKALKEWRLAYYKKLGIEAPAEQTMMELKPMMVMMPDQKKVEKNDSNEEITDSSKQPTPLPFLRELRWNLSTALEDSQTVKEFSVWIRMHADSVLIFEKPSLLTSTGSAYLVKGLRFLINGKQYAMPNFSLIHTETSTQGLFSYNVDPIIADESPTIKTTLSHTIEAVPLGDNLIDQLQITPQFEILKPLAQGAPRRSCRAIEDFKDQVLPTLEIRNCQSCHGRVDVQKPQELCNEMLNYINFEEPSQSTLLGLVLGKNQGIKGLSPHPKVIPHAEEILPHWVDWIDAEYEAQESNK